MLNFTTQTVVNELVNGFGHINNHRNVCGEFGPEADAASLRLARGLDLDVCGVKKVYKNCAVAGVLPKVEIDLASLTPDCEDIYRIALYIQLCGSENSYYANALAEKGKPLFVEASGVDSAEDLAAMFVKNVKKYQQMMYENDLVTVSAEGSVVTIEGVDNHQVFKKVELQQLVANTVGGYESFVRPDKFKTLFNEEDTTGVIEVTDGVQEFGTYRWLLENLRLPTGANLRWNHILQDEAPVPGATYTQYTVHYEMERGPLGHSVVGHKVTSMTKHAFYVNDAVAAEFEEVFTDGSFDETSFETDGQVLVLMPHDAVPPTPVVKYKVIMNKGAHVKTATVNPTSVEAGGSVVFDASFDDGYVLDHYEVNGATVTSPYTPTDNVTVNVIAKAGTTTTSIAGNSVIANAVVTGATIQELFDNNPGLKTPQSATDADLTATAATDGLFFIQDGTTGSHTFVNTAGNPVTAQGKGTFTYDGKNYYMYFFYPGQPGTIKVAS